MRILAVNCGSSSLKAHLYDAAASGLTSLAEINIDRIGSPPAADHRGAFAIALRDLGGGEGIEAIGHRVVQGGRYVQPARIDDDVVASIRQARELAPLHNGPSLAGIEAAGELFPGVPMVAVFDTAFHAAMPPVALEYALPEEVARKYGVRRYGYHGIAHRWMTERYAALVGRDRQDVSLITLQLGNGCSAAAIRDGRSVDTSMGFTPLEGLVMGTRSGDIDAGVVTHLQRTGGMSADDIDDLLNRQSGLLGVSGRTRNMKELLEAEAAGDERAGRAVELFCYRARKYVGAYLAVLGRVDAIIFGGGIGEHAPEVRRRICGPLAPLGLAIDPALNAQLAGNEGAFHVPESAISAWVIPVDEERIIAGDTFEVLTGERLEEQ